MKLSQNLSDTIIGFFGSSKVANTILKVLDKEQKNTMTEAFLVGQWIERVQQSVSKNFMDCRTPTEVQELVQELEDMKFHALGAISHKEEI